MCIQHHDLDASTHPCPHPTLFTARAFVRQHALLARQLKARGFELRFVRGWHQLLTIPLAATDLILVDYDSAGRADDGAHVPLSAHRLVTLLARSLTSWPTALILQTELDFVEVEDLALAGVDAIITAKLDASVCVEQITAALARRRARQRPPAPPRPEHTSAPTTRRPTGEDRPCATVPVLTSPTALTGQVTFTHALHAPMMAPLSPA